MLFAGAGGLAAQLFEDVLAMKLENVVFWSETETPNSFIKDLFNVISTDEEVTDYFTNVSRDFVLCIGDGATRKKMAERFTMLGGTLSPFISPFGTLSTFLKGIGKGTIVLRDTDIEPGAFVGDLCLVNKQCNIGHGAHISSYCDVGPMSTVSAYCFVGEGCMIGMGTIIIPGIKIGNNVTISAGSVVTKNLADNAVVAGVPAAIRFYKKK